MQRAITKMTTANKRFNQSDIHNTTLGKTPKPLMAKLTLAVLTVGMLSLTGCQTIKGVFDKGEDAIASASKTDAEYYQAAIKSLDEGKYLNATELLTELRTFYPTGPYAEQALLDLMYSQFNSKEYELAAASAEQFIKLYPNNIQIDYAYYVRGVANMQANSSALLHLAKQSQAHRDTSYLRLAFSNFQDLLSRYPSSAYAPDAAQRMLFIYSQFAENEMAAARWYIKREAYVAAANRAKWVFQYYPLSEQVPEAIAILAFSHKQLGTTDLAEEYKTLLHINYPEWLTSDGRVKLNTNRKSSLLNMLTFGKLGRADNRSDSEAVTPVNYSGATKTQVIHRAAQLRLPQTNTVSQANRPSMPTSRNRNFRLGLDLPDNGAQQMSNSPDLNQHRRIINPNVMYPDTNSGNNNSDNTNATPVMPTSPTATDQQDAVAPENTGSGNASE